MIKSHRVLVTLSDPDHTMVSKRDELILKHIRVKSRSNSRAVAMAQNHYEQLGFKVHSADHIGFFGEE
jgi:hypothetical protein